MGFYTLASLLQTCYNRFAPLPLPCLSLTQHTAWGVLSVALDLHGSVPLLEGYPALACRLCLFWRLTWRSRTWSSQLPVDAFPVQFSSATQLCPTLCNPMAPCQASLSITNSRSLLKLMSIESVMPSNHLILSHPLLLPPSIFPSIRVFSSESALRIRWPKYWSFSFSISPSNEYSGLISFRMNWLDCLAVQGTLKSLLQHHSSKASILQPSAFFIVQFSYPSVTTGKTIALTRWTFVGKVMSLLFNMLSRLIIAFLLRSKCLLISQPLSRTDPSSGSSGLWLPAWFQRLSHPAPYCSSLPSSLFSAGYWLPGARMQTYSTASGELGHLCIWKLSPS